VNTPHAITPHQRPLPPPAFRRAPGTLLIILGIIFLLPACAHFRACDPRPPGLVSWWRAEGDATDKAGGNNGTLQGGAGFAAGKVGQAFNFNGNGQYVEIPKSPSLDVGNQVTVDFWMNTDPGNPIGQRGEQGLVASDFYVMEIENDAGRAGVDFAISTDGGNSWVISGMTNGAGLVFPVGQWHHVAATYDGTQIQIYLDGQPSGRPTPASGPISPMRPTSFVTIGSEDGRLYCPECTANRYYKGLIDEVDIFNRALSPFEIQAIYNAGSAGKCRH
jgi:hypothetical protein